MHVPVPHRPVRTGSQVSEDHQNAKVFGGGYPHHPRIHKKYPLCPPPPDVDAAVAVAVAPSVSLMKVIFTLSLPFLPLPLRSTFRPFIRPCVHSTLRARVILRPHPHPPLSFPLSLVLGCFSVWSSQFLFLSFFLSVCILSFFCVVFPVSFLFWVGFSVPFFLSFFSLKVPASIHDTGVFPVSYTFSFSFFFFISSLVLGDARDARAEIGEMVPKGGELIL